MNAPQLTKNVVNNYKVIKKVGPQIEKLLPDKRAAEYLLEQFKRGNTKAWLTAYILGCNGHEAGYATTRKILLGGHRQQSESYAGVAMALIRGMAAYEDLYSIVFSTEEGKVRRGAAYGMVKLKPPRVVDDLLDAYEQKLLPRGDVASHLSKCGVSDERLIQLLSQEERHQRLALGVVSSLDYEGCPQPMPGREVAIAVLRVMQAGTAKTHPLIREKIFEWARKTAN